MCALSAEQQHTLVCIFAEERGTQLSFEQFADAILDLCEDVPVDSTDRAGDQVRVPGAGRPREIYAVDGDLRRPGCEPHRRCERFAAGVSGKGPRCRGGGAPALTSICVKALLPQ